LEEKGPVARVQGQESRVKGQGFRNQCPGSRIKKF
jgi:hypothetical protein